jgi:hypothetical protein
MEYTPSYRGEREQIDGAFRHSAFHYLVEVKWERGEATLAALDTFKAKVDRKLSSTRGLFLSISGFHDEVIVQFQANATRNVVLMSGEDLTLILEGRLSMQDALDLKTNMAAQKGSLFVALREHV